jgi:hypothetical protein
VLTEPVPPEKGLPHLRDIQVSKIKAVGAKQAFSVASYKDSPLANLQFKDTDIEAARAGNIQYAEGWSFVGLKLKIGDGSKVTVKDSRGVVGLPE